MFVDYYRRKINHWPDFILWVLVVIVVGCLMWQKQPVVVDNEPNDVVIVERDE